MRACPSQTKTTVAVARQQTTVPRLRVIVLVMASLSLAGCGGDAAEARFDDYKTRLGRALQQEMTEPHVQPPARRPRKRDLQLEQRESRINILDFLRLYECSLGEVIGQRNSILGKVAPASQRLFNDLAFLQEAPLCIEQLRDNERDALADKLTEAVAIKRDELPKAIANATLGSDEFASFWSVPTALSDFPSGSSSELIGELHYLSSEVKRWLSGDYRHDPARFENALGAVRHGQAGSLLSAATLTQSQLQSASAMADARLARRPLCFNGKATEQGRILGNVVEKFFVGDVQRWLARVNELRYDLLAPYRELETLLGDARSGTYIEWQQRRDEQLDWLSSAPRAHVQSVRPLLASCGLAPGD